MIYYEINYFFSFQLTCYTFTCMESMENIPLQRVSKMEINRNSLQFFKVKSRFLPEEGFEKLKLLMGGCGFYIKSFNFANFYTISHLKVYTLSYRQCIFNTLKKMQYSEGSLGCGWSRIKTFIKANALKQILICWLVFSSLLSFNCIYN